MCKEGLGRSNMGDQQGLHTSPWRTKQQHCCEMHLQLLSTCYSATHPWIDPSSNQVLLQNCVRSATVLWLFPHLWPPDLWQRTSLKLAPTASSTVT